MRGGEDVFSLGGGAGLEADHGLGDGGDGDGGAISTGFFPSGFGAAVGLRFGVDLADRLAVDGADVADADVVALGGGVIGLLVAGALFEDLLQVLVDVSVGDGDRFDGDLDGLPVRGLEVRDDVDFVAEDRVGAGAGFLLDVGDGVDREGLFLLDAFVALGKEALADLVGDLLAVLQAHDGFRGLARAEAGEGGLAREALEDFLLGGGDGRGGDRHGDGAAGRVSFLDFDVHGRYKREEGPGAADAAGGMAEQIELPPTVNSGRQAFSGLFGQPFA